MVFKVAPFFVLLSIVSVSGYPYSDLTCKFNRIKSRVTVRHIEQPTLANLDFAAYDKNPVLLDAVKVKLKNKPATPELDKITFENTLSDIKDNINATPLSDIEKNTPLAWKPFIKKLWNVVKDDKLQQMGSKIASYKWADPDVYQPYQEITTAYLHEENNQNELWVKVEFCNWVSFLPNVQDEDNDGFREIYGILNLSTIDPDSLKKVVNWVKEEYTARILDKEEMTDWITDLASYWYPTKNTDILELGESAKWPVASTSKKVIKELCGKKFSNPLAVIEGKPVSPDKPIYNVYIIDEEIKADVAVEPAKNNQQPATISQIDTSLSDNFTKNNTRFHQEVTEFGSYDEWYQKNGPFLNGASKWLSTFPAEQMGLEGDNGWLFFRKSFEYMFGKDYSTQTPEKNPVPNLVDFKNYLKDKNVNLLFVVVPNKEEVYYDKISSSIPAPIVKYVNPYSRKILADLQASGIEVIDLLPYFLEARTDDTTGNEFLYQLQDTHWTNRGLQIAAKLIADRIKNYSWYNSLEKVMYQLKDTTFERQGDIVERIPEQSKTKYQAVQLKAQQVITSDGTLYKGNNANAPVMLIGDSFTGVFESVDCKGAGVGAHIAQKSSIPVDIITSWGGGPLVRSKAMRAREKTLPNKHLVIYMMVARDLYNYSQNWEKFPE